MNSIKTIYARIDVPLDMEDTFALVTNWEFQQKWVLATKVWGVGETSNKLGGKIEAFTGLKKLGFLDTMTITKWDPPNLCEVTHTGSVVKGSGIFEVSNLDNKTFLTWTETTIIPFGFIGKFGWIIVSPFIKLGMIISLRRFRKLL
ncbi:MAG: SRPBCC family protein [bacterium]|nr:SRPBCC family protein [bacterium]